MDSDEILINLSKYLAEADKIENFSADLEKQIAKSHTYFYSPDERIISLLQQFRENLNIKKPTKSEYKIRGELLEQIIYLAFRSFSGLDSFKSFQSAGAQYDLLVTGDNSVWSECCKILCLKNENRKILIEGKAKETRVKDQDFARLCSIMETTMPNVGLGIFFSLAGATGYPKKDKEPRQRSVRDCLLRSILFNARHQKCVIVFDEGDIFELDQAGSLMTLIRRKIKDIEELSGLPTIPINQFIEVDLPVHLSQYIENDFETTNTSLNYELYNR